MKSFKTKAITATYIDEYFVLLAPGFPEEGVCIPDKLTARALGRWLLKVAEPKKSRVSKGSKGLVRRFFDNAVEIDCGGSKRYKGIRQPTCSGGYGCCKCWDKYWERNGL
jgi:hypothetical protein